MSVFDKWIDEIKGYFVKDVLPELQCLEVSMDGNTWYKANGFTLPGFPYLSYHRATCIIWNTHT